MSRIGFCGPQSVGKTTILNVLRSESIFTNYHIGEETTRRVKSYGLPINEQSGDITQRLIMQEHIVNVFMHENLLTDRTALDCLVYTQYLHSKGSVSLNTLAFIQQIALKILPQYDVLFAIRPEFDIVDDGVRSVDVAFRDEISDRFDAAYLEYKDMVNIVPISGSVRQRANRVFDYILLNNLVKE